MIETLHENDVDAILITIVILCKSTEVYRRAPRPPDPRWWEQEGPTDLTHPQTNCAIFVPEDFFPFKRQLSEQTKITVDMSSQLNQICI